MSETPAAPPIDVDAELGELIDLTPLVRTARRGFRRDVAQLVAQLQHGALLVPLAEPIDDVEIGQVQTPQGQDVRLVPHLLRNEQGMGIVPLFTDADALRTVGQYARWTTGKGPDLDYCTLPALAALDLALQLVDGQRIMAAVINPSDDDELLLQRHELGALVQGKAIPLVGYVGAIAVDPSETVLIAETGPKDPRLTAAIEQVLHGKSDVSSYLLQHAFNAERDLEPHPTLTILLIKDAALDRDALGRELFQALEGLLPEPGYIDVLFETQANQAN